MLKSCQNVKKTDVSAAEFVYNPSQIHLYAYDLHEHLSLVKNSFNEPALCAARNLSKPMATNFFTSLKKKLSKNSSPQLDIIEIDKEQEIEDLFAIIQKENFPYFKCLFNYNMRNIIDLQQIANP